MARLFAFLDSVRAVFDGRACIAEPGARYMGIAFRFPAAEVDPWTPQDPRPLEIDLLKQRIMHTLDQAS